ncbi:BrnA antitoxin family protein [Cupriavidus neocaledonicus]|uniref:BrnA antitoxin family protein n=1 Tax=Cupriavidus neocaledonicus TaxID=1040979 RepID=UPI002691CA28
MLGDETVEALAKRRGRPAKPVGERKVNQTLRIDPDVLAPYKATGSGWQTLMNEALRDYPAARRMLPRRQAGRSRHSPCKRPRNRLPASITALSGCIW